tara:strand:- start:1451 stop:2212 length:762 start_codon:yes stop_codon:yes gene_type:complete
MMLEIFILSIIQGITEFLPISSSSHLILISKYLDFTNSNLTIDISLHIGSFFAVVFYFRKDLSNLYQNKDLFFKIFLSSIPIMLVGFVLVKYGLATYFRSVEIIGWTTFVFGILLFISDRFKNKKDIKNDFNLKSALIIGLLQILSLIPGVSRSGIAITASRFLKFKRTESAKISFLLSIPILAAVSCYGLFEIFYSNQIFFSILNILAIVLSFIFSYLTIKYFLVFLRKFSLTTFVYYRLILGLVIIIYAYI